MSPGGQEHDCHRTGSAAYYITMVKTQSLLKSQFLHGLNGDTVRKLHFLRLLGGLKKIKFGKMLKKRTCQERSLAHSNQSVTTTVMLKDTISLLSKEWMTDKKLTQATGCLH